MDGMSSKKNERSRRHAAKHRHEWAVVQVYAISGDTVTSVNHHCLIAERSRAGLRLICEEALPVGERIDITVDLGFSDGSRTFTGIPRNLAVAYESSGYLVDVELVSDHRTAAWRHQFH